MSEMSVRDKVTALFQYIREFANLKRTVITNVEAQYWNVRFMDIPVNEQYIMLNKDVDGNSTFAGTVLFSIVKPELTNCPEPDDVLNGWLNAGWNDPVRELSVREYIEHHSDEATVTKEAFAEDPKRVTALSKWEPIRNRWAEQQRILLPIRHLFAKLYELHLLLDRDTDSKEFIVGCGMLRDSQNQEVSHPVLTKRLQLEFEASSNTIRVLDTEAAPELYTSLLTSVNEFNLDVLPHYAEQLSVNGYHPMDAESTTSYLRQLIHSLSADSQYVEMSDTDCTERFLLSFEPVFFVRTRSDGTINAIDAVLSSIANGDELPAHIGVLAGDNPVVQEEEYEEKSLPVQLAEVGGEDSDILLTKPANKEQLEIARRIAKRDAVLVQGPPGTGKTHTIANLLGHFLAQGKTVLVTSHTKKALSVVKEKVEEDLQDLCVAMLDDNNSDMEKSVDGITDMTSRHSLHELREKIQSTSEKRYHIIDRLAKVRQMIFDIQNSEFSPIVIGGESISPANAAKFVHEHPEYDVIPGKVELYRVLPLSYKELQELYSSNTLVTTEEENELAFDLPDAEMFLAPSEFRDLTEEFGQLHDELEAVCSDNGYIFEKKSDGTLELQGKKSILIKSPSFSGLAMLEERLQSFDKLEEWMIHAAVDGRKGGGFLKNWQTLFKVIQETIQVSEANVEILFSRQISFVENTDFNKVRKNLPEMLEIIKKKGKLRAIDLIFHNEFKYVCASCKVNGDEPKGYDDYRAIDVYLQLQALRENCARCWDQLLARYGVPAFASLDAHSPEAVAVKMIHEIQKYLSWYHTEYPMYTKAMRALGILDGRVFAADVLTSDIDEIQNLLVTVESVFPMLASVVRCSLRSDEIQQLFDSNGIPLVQKQRNQSSTCRMLYTAIQERDAQAYETAYYHLQELYAKYSVLKQRKEALEKLYSAAPDWAYAIRNRVGVHGSNLVPEQIDQIWRWKQYDEILKALSKESLPKLQQDSMQLSKQYRTSTAELAKWKAWYELQRRIEGDLEVKSSLQSWRLITKRTGKARKMTGILRREAQTHMRKCQEAVPAWIVPMNKALENFTPGKNIFDVIIVDEASQSSITALVVTYMARKVIIVGDDKQVSPTGVGLDIDKMVKLAEGTIKEIIPSWSLYTGNSSLYDIVSTVYPSLMLREHFRCVPDIIGYSNKLSYDNKIKPLRDTSGNKLLPAVVNYRTKGHRDGKRKQNELEAKTIVALIKACIENDAYAGKTMGIISLLGDEQSDLIGQYLMESINPAEIEKRHIIYGSPAQFQGDERDVIFLSMVDSNETEGPLHTRGYGTDDMYRKRYNVAVSRAKDQLWVVHSLDSARDLKEGDIRKGLLDYAQNPKAYLQQIEQVAKNAESPFEEYVGKALVAKGYSICQQWPVGSYRLDIVAVDGKEKVAIECDGERWHSSETQVRNDMERQTILERLGWRFIRIRGSEYFLDPESTMNRVYAELETLGIHPTGSIQVEELPEEDLLVEIKQKAAQFLAENGVDVNPGSDAVAIEKSLSLPEEDDSVKKIAVVDSGITEQLTMTEVIAMPVRSAPKYDIPKVETHTMESKQRATVVTAKANSEARKKREPKPSAVKEADKVKVKEKTINSVDLLIEELRKLHVEVIDNRKQSKIVWVIQSADTKEAVGELLSNSGCKFVLERRGAIATNNRPAWRINV